MHNCHEKRMNSNGCVSNDVGRRVEFDAIRVLATVFVVVFHFNCCFEKYGVTGFHQVMYSFANGDFGQLGVALFFMLSGESLIAKNKDEFNTLSFYKRRMKRILPAYYISWIYVYIYVSYVKGIYVPLQNLNWRMIFTFTVVDGWLWGITNTFFLVGEWFTGVLIILYLLFPVLRWIYNKHFIEGTLVIALIYCLNFRYKFLFFGDGWFSLSNGLMLFWLGMSIERYKAVLYKISPVILGIGCWVHFMISMPFNALIKNIVGGGILYLFICTAVSRLSIKKMPRVGMLICKYSYIFYLLHHRIFYFVFERISGKTLFLGDVICLFAICILILVAVSLLISMTEKIIYRLLKWQ